MGLRICILGSGSSGNSTLVSSGTTSILVDAGLSGRRTAARLEEAGVAVAGLHGICLSHEHQDHAAGTRILHRKYGVPLFANAGTIDALARQPEWAGLPWQRFITGQPFSVGDLRIDPFSVPHDAYDPVGFVIEHQGVRVGIVTDMGMATSLIRERLRPCQAVVIEANHDEQLLQDAPRPWSLKQRIRGRQGHLSNQAAAEVLAEIAGPGLQQVYLAHLSEDCNRPDLARETIYAALASAGHGHVRVELASAACISAVWESAVDSPPPAAVVQSAAP